MAWGLLLMSWIPCARAHTMTMTEVTVTFAQPGRLDVKIGIDLTQILGSPERYLALVTAPAGAQLTEVRKVLPEIERNLRLMVGGQALSLAFEDFTSSTADRRLIVEGSMSTLSTLHFVAALPASVEPLTLVVPLGANIDYPVVFTIRIPSANVSLTRWLEDGVHGSEPFDWAAMVPKSMLPRESSASTHDPGAVSRDTDALSWPRQAALYLRLGFRHIVPDGADHILFVLGLFFLGISWRKLLSQTTVFTIAHATTLFLSSYGIWSLPSRFVEPAIAGSIAAIAVENVLSPRLGPARLAVVFGFGLIHGLGFASSLSDIPLPKHDFLLALLGFNFGVDLGQLFVVAMAFLAVGAFRDKTWFRARIAIPSSIAIAAIGTLWAIQRIVFYGPQY